MRDFFLDPACHRLNPTVSSIELILGFGGFLILQIQKMTTTYSNDDSAKLRRQIKNSIYSFVVLMNYFQNQPTTEIWQDGSGDTLARTASWIEY